MWGEQHWLVPSDQLTLFAYAVNSRSGDPYTIAYLKYDDGEKRRTRYPDLPAQYKRFLKRAPIKTKIVGIGPKIDDWYSSMTIDSGKDKGVIEGMSFWLIGQKNITLTLTVSKVGERTSEVSVVEAGRSADFDMEITPAIGWRFTSIVPKDYR